MTETNVLSFPAVIGYLYKVPKPKLDVPKNVGRELNKINLDDLFRHSQKVVHLRDHARFEPVADIFGTEEIEEIIYQQEKQPHTEFEYRLFIPKPYGVVLRLEDNGVELASYDKSDQDELLEIKIRPLAGFLNPKDGQYLGEITLPYRLVHDVIKGRINPEYYTDSEAQTAIEARNAINGLALGEIIIRELRRLGEQFDDAPMSVETPTKRDNVITLPKKTAL